jgi:hypothetical protein
MGVEALPGGKAIEVIHPVGKRSDRTKQASMSGVMHSAAFLPILLIIDI